jgi:hypothetical protein
VTSCSTPWPTRSSAPRPAISAGSRPPDSETPRGVDSRSPSRGWSDGPRRRLTPASVDLTITGARPRLGTRLPEIGGGIASASASRPRVSVKASTGNLIGAEGAGAPSGARAVAVPSAPP